MGRSPPPADSNLTPPQYAEVSRPRPVPILFFVVIEATTQLLRQGRHAALLCANVGRYIYSQTVCNTDGFAPKQCGTESTGKGITGSYRVGYLYFGGVVIGAFVRREYITAAGSTGDYDNLQGIIFDDGPSYGPWIEPLIAKHLC